MFNNRFSANLLLIIILSFLTVQVYSQTITSTTAGGRWELGSTWVGGVIPAFSSNVVINGPVIFSTGSGYSCNNLTVNSSGTLYNGVGYAWPDQVLTINGSLTNNGTIRNEGGNGLVIKVKGNITNSGKWTFRRTELIGTGTQTISSTNNSKFENHFLVDATSKPSLAAGSDLIFTTTVDLSKSTLDAKNFSITLKGESANITNGKVINTAMLTGSPVLSGTSLYFPIINDVTYEGTITIKGRLRINSTVVMNGNVTNTDTLENSTGYAHPEKKLTINGSFTNNGLVRNGGSAGFALTISGNVTNNGTWIHNRTELGGSSNQVLTLGNGKIFESPFKVTDQSGQIVAGSALSFTSWFDLNKCSFDLKNYSVTLKGSSANISNGVVFNVADLVGRSTSGSPSYPILSNILYDGKINLKGILRIDWGVTMRGAVAVADTIENSTGYAHPEKILKIIGELTNNGLIRDGGSSGFVVDVTGNITANKKISNKRVQLAGTGNRTIYDKLSTIQYLSTGEKVVLFGINYMPNLSIASTSKCQLANGAKLVVPDNNIDEQLDNWSDISVTRKISSSLSYTYFKARVNLTSTSNLDSIKIQSYGHQVPSTFSNAVKCWWRINTYAKVTGKQSFSSFSMIYNDDLLGTNNEATIQIYHSEDEGKTWKQISTTVNTTRDASKNTITIANAPGYGDYLLSSYPDPYSVRPSIIASIIGRENIRVGVPNRYSIHYVNNSDIETGDMLMQIKTTDRISIKQVEPSMPAGKTQQIYPQDKLTVEKQDSVAMLYVTSMAPREERILNVVLTPLPGSNKVNESMWLPLIIVAVEWAGTAIVIDYTADLVGNIGKELWRPVPLDCPSLWSAFKNAFWDGVGKTNYNWFGHEKPMGTIAEESAQELVKKVGFESVDKVSAAKKIYEATEKQIEGMKDYVEGKSEVLDCGGNKKKLVGEVSSTTKTTKKVASWDPNEKIGPSGYGDKKFITSAGKMNYQILFENKKEATAPAWKVSIVDTLSSVFDPETFEFGKTSHDGPQYNWVKTRTGNIIKWEIEGIELPPNVTPPEGEGWVSFTVNTKPNLASGTNIKNAATIVFDMNKPIRTNEYVNVLDFKSPTSTMKPLAASIKGSRLTVKWTSDDGSDGSGIESAAVYMSVDKGEYKFVGASKTDSLAVSILNGTHSYSFYSIAKDNVGNVELSKPSAVSTSFTNSVEQFGDELPMSYSLEQNYPNPFNPETVIRFSIPRKTKVLLEVYNLLGQKISQLINQELNPSKYEVNFDGSKYASGVYFYKLSTADFTQTKKMLLIK